MSYVPVVSWGIYKGGTNKQLLNAFASWGLLQDAPIPSTPTITRMIYNVIGISLSMLRI